MNYQPLKVMAVDDDELNLEILTKNLNDAHYESIAFDDGDTAWKFLEKHPDEIDVVLLDKVMPGMNGMELLEKMKANVHLKDIPVIIQTGDVGVNELKECLTAGAYYYLSKPFDPSVMISLVNAAVRDCVFKNKIQKKMQKQAQKAKYITSLITEGKFSLKTIDEANHLSAAIAHGAENPSKTGMALAELMINAIEHGNLGISYEEKNQLLKKDQWEEEVAKRLTLPEYADKSVEVQYRKTGNTVSVMIKDQGKGFDWKKYMEFDPIRLTDPNGRGIATAKLMELGIKYNDAGNAVICKFKYNDNSG